MLLVSACVLLFGAEIRFWLDEKGQEKVWLLNYAEKSDIGGDEGGGGGLPKFFNV